MDQNGIPYAGQDARRMLESEQGQQLLRLLTKDGGGALRQAAEALRRGDTARAKELLSPILSSEEAAGLIDQLSRR